MEKSNFDIKKMSRETGVSVFLIKTILGIKFKDKQTQRGTGNNGSALEGLYVSKKQIELSLLEIEKATTVTEAKRAYRYAPAEIKASALIKWCGLTTTTKHRLSYPPFSIAQLLFQLYNKSKSYLQKSFQHSPNVMGFKIKKRFISELISTLLNLHYY